MANESPESRLAALGIILPQASSPAANYVNTVEVNGLLFVAGKGPAGRDGVKPHGKLGAEYTTAEGYEFARQTGIEILAVLKAELGSLDRSSASSSFKASSMPPRSSRSIRRCSTAVPT